MKYGSTYEKNGRVVVDETGLIAAGRNCRENLREFAAQRKKDAASTAAPKVATKEPKVPAHA